MEQIQYKYDGPLAIFDAGKLIFEQGTAGYLRTQEDALHRVKNNTLSLMRDYYGINRFRRKETPWPRTFIADDEILFHFYLAKVYDPDLYQNSEVNLPSHLQNAPLVVRYLKERFSGRQLRVRPTHLEHEANYYGDRGFFVIAIEAILSNGESLEEFQGNLEEIMDKFKVEDVTNVVR